MDGLAGGWCTGCSFAVLFEAVLPHQSEMVILCLLSQDHYDWGLRAIKSVLVVAGSLKRGDPGSAEDQVLMRALRDFNIPKIVTDDLPVFLGLIGDLFPSLDAPRKRDLNFEKVQAQAFHHCRRWPSPGRVQRLMVFSVLLGMASSSPGPFHCKVVSACSPSQVIRESVLELKLQAEENFVLKVVQLEELLQVRHSVFIVGNAGTGKSQVAAKPS